MRVAIVGSSQTKHERCKKNLTKYEMIYPVVKDALSCAGLEIKDIDTVVVASSDFLDGIAISNSFTAEVLGAHLKDETKVADDGAFSLVYAYMRILSGLFNTALVVGYSKPSESNIYMQINTTCDPFYQRPLGLEAISASALQARVYMERYKITEEQTAKVAVKNRKNAKNNPYAQLKIDIDVSDVMRSEVLASPIKKLDSSPISDGASAVVLANEDIAKRLTDKPVWIKGVGWCIDEYYLGYKDLSKLKSLQKATNIAYTQALISNPKSEIDVFEVTEFFSFYELMIYEAIGLCKEGEGGKLIDEGVTEFNGELPVNPSGGVLSANPIMATGLVRIIEAMLQIKGEAQERQIPKKVNKALAHSSSGLCMQGNCVIVLSGE